LAYREEDRPGPEWRSRQTVVLIALESFRADAVGATLGGRPVTPVLDALSATGASSSRAYSHNGYTVQLLSSVQVGAIGHQQQLAQHGWCLLHNNAATAIALHHKLAKGVFALNQPGMPGRAAAPDIVLLHLPLQGSTVLWRPQWLEFPEMTVRCDVVIKGPRLDDALGLLAELLTSDLQELEAVPVYFVEGLRLVDSLGEQQCDSRRHELCGRACCSCRQLAA
jgi:hypothetical protein